MKTVIRVSIEKQTDGASMAQQDKSNDILVVLEQYGVLFTPEQYKQLWEKLKDIKALVVQADV